MQYKIPQEISGEDKLIGPLSLRQLIIVGVGGGIAYLMYTSLVRIADPIMYVPPMAIIILLTVAVAFFKKDNLTFTHMILLFIETVINPPKRFWMQMSGDISPFKVLETYTQSLASDLAQKKDKMEEKKIDDISKLVKIIDYTPNEDILEEEQKRWIVSDDKRSDARGGMLEKLLQESAKTAAQTIKNNSQTN